MSRVPFGVGKILLSAMLLLVPETAAAISLCLADDTGPRSARSASAGARSSAVEFSEVPSALGGTQRHLSFNGTNAYVYGHFAGCAERYRFSPTEGLTLSYSAVKGVDPFDRLRGQTRDAESFFDAEYSSKVEDVGKVGYSISGHAATVSGVERAEVVRGGRLWFGTPDERLRLSSEMAVSESRLQQQTGMAQRHQMSLVLVKAEDVNLSTDFFYSHVDPEFRGRRSAALSDREAVGATTNLRVGDAAFVTRFSQSHNNVDDRPNARTHYWRAIDTEASYRLDDAQVLPDRIRVYASQFDDWEAALDERGSDRNWNMTRRVGLAATWAKRQWHSRFSFGENWDEWLGQGTATEGDGTVDFGGNLFANWTTDGKPEDLGYLGGGDAWVAVDLSEFGPVPGRVESRALLTNGSVFSSNVGWRWDVTAEIDGLDLLFDRPSGNATFMVGRLGSTVREDETCSSIDYRSMLVAGFRF